MTEHRPAVAAADPAPHPSAIPKRCPACAARYPADFRVCPRDAIPLEDAEPDADPVVGSVLSETYEVLRCVGEGGMGRVYEAAHRRLRNKRFAIKVLHPELARQPEVVSRFQREAEAASVLSHPNVVEVFDVNCTPDGRPYIVAQLLEGEDLGRYLERIGRLEVVAAVRIVRQICDALSAAHARGIVHRDVKPENVFLTGQPQAPRVKMLDFGISKLGDGKGTLTKTGVVMGTPAYMPPEQARGSHVDHRADIYAVGAILYRALTGEKPFDDGDPIATLAAVLGQEPRRPSSIERSIPPALELVIQKAMAKEPDERHPSLAALEGELALFDPQGAAASATAQGHAQAAPFDASHIEGTAHTVLDPSSLRTPATRLDENAQRARGARSSIVLLTAFGGGWLLAGLLDAVTSAVFWFRDSAALTRTEVTLSAVGTIAALVTPGTLWVRHLAQRIWPNTPRAMATAARLRGALQVSLALYALATVGAHAFVALVRREPPAAAWPAWPAIAFGIAWIGAGAAYMLSGRHRSRGTG